MTARDVTLSRALELGRGLETVIFPGIGRATGYAGPRDADRIELGPRVVDHAAFRYGPLK